MPRRSIPLVSALALAAVTLSGCSAPTAAEADGVTVDTVIGEVTVPETIDSVVVLEGRRDLDIVLSLDLPLVGFPYEGPDSGLELEAPLASATSAAMDDGATEMFLADEINLEAIAEAAPSVIIGRIDDVEPILDELRAIAPVIPVSSHSDGVTWQEDLALVAEATGTEAKAEELIAEYDARVAEIAETYATQIADTVVVAPDYDVDSASVQATRLQSLILAELGASPSSAFTASLEAGDAVEFSPEQTLDAFSDADAILALVNSSESWEATQNDALWQQLPAVQAGNVVRSDKMTHEGAQITAMHVLDLIEQLYQTV
jgi:iron complex transport system substrate-binding protein